MKLITPNEYITEEKKSELVWKLLNALIADRKTPRRDSE